MRLIECEYASYVIELPTPKEKILLTFDSNVVLLLKFILSLNLTTSPLFLTVYKAG